MAVLNETDRRGVWAEVMQVLSSERESTSGLTKSELRAAVDATDQWVEDNQGSFNAALPLPARSTLKKSQKALLFFRVADKRFGVL